MGKISILKLRTKQDGTLELLINHNGKKLYVDNLEYARLSDEANQYDMELFKRDKSKNLEN